jgi:hypothetical protein
VDRTRYALRDLITNRREALIAEIVSDAQVAVAGEVAPYEDGDIAQMVHGFLSLLLAALESSDAEVRSFYLESVMPGLRDSGVPISVMIAGCTKTLIQMSARLILSLPPELQGPGIAWLSDYLGNYLGDITRVWEVAP